MKILAHAYRTHQREMYFIIYLHIPLKMKFRYNKSESCYMKEILLIWNLTIQKYVSEI